MNRFDELYEREGADKAYYLACAFDVANNRAEFWAACRMFNACHGLDIGCYIGGALFQEEDSDGMSEGQYDVWRVEAGEFREHMDAHPHLKQSWFIDL